MKSAISVPDRLFREADRLAKRMKVSRSELYRRAMEAFLETARDRDVKASYDEAFGTPDSPADVAFRRRAARNALLAVEWSQE
jgi:hypothetical protein